MTARLFSKTGDLAGTEFEIEREATIGKSTGNTIVLAPGTISGQHARIYFDDNTQSYFLEDTKSRNGTRLDGMPVSGPERLGRLHVITFANAYDFIFIVPQGAGQISPQPPVGISEEPVDPRSAVSPTAAVQDLPSVPQVLNVDRASGRTMAESDIPLLAPDLQPGSAPAGPKTMAESDIPLLAPNFQRGTPPPAGPKTMAESDIPLMTPKLQGNQPASPKTMAASDIPQIPKFGNQQPPQQPAPPPARQQQARQQQPPEPGRTMAESDIPLLPQFKAPSAQPAATQTGRYILEVMKDNKQFVLSPGENIVGRSEKSKIPIEHSTVSRKHAVFTVAGSRITLKDLGSANHTFVDNQKIESEVEVTTVNKIRFGQVEVRLLSQR